MANFEDYDREFPSLSNNSQISSSGQASMWSMAGSRNTGVPVQRNQGTPQATAQQNDQNDFFSASSRIASNQGSFRFGSQASANQSSQVQAGAPDDFPPLNRNGNGDIGQDRGASLMSTIGFGAQGSRAGNGLLNALSANSRSSEVRSPTSGM
jgi:CCR4-NOT transcription complex subunit 2